MQQKPNQPPPKTIILAAVAGVIGALAFFGLAVAELKLGLGAKLKTLGQLHMADPVAPLHIDLWTLPGCEVGDLDIIDHDLQADPTLHLLFTIEPLASANGAQLPDTVIELPRDALQNGWQTHLRLPMSGRDSLFGIFICSAATAAGPCRDRPVQPMAQLANNLLEPGGAQPRQYSGQGKIYWFQPLYATNGGIFYADATTKRSIYYQAFKHIGSMVDGTGDQPSPSWQRIRQLTEALSPVLLQPAADHNTLAIRLKRLDSDHCRHHTAERFDPGQVEAETIFVSSDHHPANDDWQVEPLGAEEGQATQ